MSETTREHSSFRPVPRTGVIYVTTEARKRGFVADHPDWCNLGQGQPEAGQLPGAPKRVEAVTIDLDDHEYAPVAGLMRFARPLHISTTPSTARGKSLNTRRTMLQFAVEDVLH